MVPRLRCTVLACLIASANTSMAASEPPTSDEIRLAVDRALYEALSQRPAPEGVLTIEQPERQSFELGAVIDVRKPDATGLPVVAISPGSAAERLGLKVGDRLLGVNGQDVAGAVAPGTVLLQALQNGDGDLTMQVLRGSAQMTLAGSVDLVTLPAYRLVLQPSATTAANGCGYLSGGAEIAADVRKVDILSINGEPAPTDFWGRLRLVAGEYTLSVKARPLPAFNGANARAQRLMDATTPTGQRRRDYPGVSDALSEEPESEPVDFSIRIRPNVSYRIGMRVDTDGRPHTAFIAEESEKACALDAKVHGRSR